jgi:hypothetical protein
MMRRARWAWLGASHSAEAVTRLPPAVEAVGVEEGEEETQHSGPAMAAQNDACTLRVVQTERAFHRTQHCG